MKYAEYQAKFYVSEKQDKELKELFAKWRALFPQENYTDAYLFDTMITTNTEKLITERAKMIADLLKKTEMQRETRGACNE